MYIGQTFSIVCGEGGLDHNSNIDAIAPQSMVDGSKNINLNKGGREKRGGTSLVGTSAMGTAKVMGIFDYRTTGGDQFLMRFTNDGQLWKDETTVIGTGLGSNKRCGFAVMDDKVFIATESAAPRYWEGTSASATIMTSIPTDWSSSGNYPVQLVLHGNGVAERMWAFGFLDGSIYASKSADGTDFSDAEIVKIIINTGDGYGIVAGFTYGDRLFACGKKQTFIIDDSDTDTTKWGYAKAQFEAGVAHHRLIVNTPNDVVMMAPDGEIYSFTAVNSYGDYKQASLTRPAHMDVWIQENIDLTKIEEFHAAFDPVLRAIKFFMVKSGSTECDLALVYYIDRPPEQAWMIHDNEDYASGYNAACSCVYRKSLGTDVIYTGDYDGQIWELETSNRNDNDNGYKGSIKTPNLVLGDPRATKLFHQGRLVAVPQGNYDMTIKVWVDGQYAMTSTVSLAASGAALGSFTLDSDTLGGTELADIAFDLGLIGKRIQFEIYNSNADEEFFISQILIDFKSLGALND